MQHHFGYGQLLKTAEQARTTTAQALRILARMLTNPEAAKRLGNQLMEWREGFESLDRALNWRLTAARAGVYDPIGLGRLLSRAQQIITGFDGFLRQTGVPGEESPRMDGQQVVPIGEHTLPPLPYAYNALEPYIDEQTMRLHHDKHHKSYVDGLNKAERMMEEARDSGDFDLIKHWEREAAFNGAGHYLHTIFWNVMKPGGGGQPAGALAQAINDYFGSFERFKDHFSAAAEKVEGGGWAQLVWSPRARHLEILHAEKHQNLSQWDVIPLLVLDVWEHAYYLKYQDERKEYIKNWWNVVNWDHVAERFERARALQWEPY